MEEKRFTLRMNGELFEQISDKAAKNHRSVAKEIEYAISEYLQSSVESREKLWGAVLASMDEKAIATFVRNVRNDEEMKKWPLKSLIDSYLKEQGHIE